MSRTLHYALVADLIGSRRIRARQELATQLEQALVHLNRAFRTHIRAPLVTTRGIDEISAILRTPACAFDLAVQLNERIWPHRFRFALARGTLDIGTGRDAAAADGPALHAAAGELQRGREKGLVFALRLEGSPEVCGLVESLGGLYFELTARWTPTRARLVRLYRELGTQQAVAERVGVTQQNVSQALRGAAVEDLFRAEAAVRAWLAGLER